VPAFCAGATRDDLRAREQYDTWLGRLRASGPGVTFYDPSQALCAERECAVFRDGKLLYGDWNHLSIYGSELVVPDLIREMRVAEN
jgi:hypothetical protein